MLGEADSLGSHAVEVGCFDDLLTVASEVTVAEIIGENIDDVGLLCRDREKAED